MDILSAIYRYCNYQERCHREVRNKLYELGCKPCEAEQYISKLIEDNLLNEERYARSFARGKFRIKNWGRNKILYQLRRNQISPFCIKKAMTEIDENEYLNTLERLTLKKWQELKKEKNPIEKKGKLFRYLQQKGYETDLIKDVFQEIPNLE